MNLIAFSHSRNCVNTQYAALSGAMHYYKKANTIGWLYFYNFLLRSILQTACCETKSKTVCYTATSWFSLVSASCTIDSTEMCFHLMANAFMKICLASEIKRTCPKKNKFGFPLTFSYRVNKKMKYDISDVSLWKNIKCVMLILFFVHDTR